MPFCISICTFLALCFFPFISLLPIVFDDPVLGFVPVSFFKSCSKPVYKASLNSPCPRMSDDASSSSSSEPCHCPGTLCCFVRCFMTAVFLFLNRVIFFFLVEKKGKSYRPKSWVTDPDLGQAVFHIWKMQNGSVHQCTSFVLSMTRLASNILKIGNFGGKLEFCRGERD